MSAENCPSQQDLRAFLAGNVFGQTAKNVAEHLDACPNCQDTLVKIDDGDDTLVARLRRPAPVEEFINEPECRAALARAEAIVEKPPRQQDLPPTELLGSSSSPATKTFSQLREYRILEHLGAGGMGTVYKALHTKLDKLVALKILPAAAMQDAALVARFEREMKAVGKLEHPNIVRAMDAGCHEGTHFLVMEYVDGMNLAEVVKRCGPLRIADACEVIRQAALGLRHADEHALVHRDIKPSNLVLNLDGEVKILDLGLALLQADRMSGEEPTGSGRAMGTVDYMAPEQIRDSHSVDIRADIYSLGCTLYKLLTGNSPFSGSQYEKTFDKMMAHLNDPVPPIRQVRPDVPEKLAAALERMLAKDRDRRYVKPGQVVEDLKPFCPGCDLAGLLANARKGTKPAVIAPAAPAGPAPVAGLATPPAPGARPVPSAPSPPARPPVRATPATTPKPAAPAAKSGALGAGLPTPPKKPTARSPESPSETTFDPYYKWLGIPPEEQPPNHYRLLGVRLFEEDREVIQAAAERQTVFLRNVALGKHSKESQELLNEIQRTKLCLLTPAEKVVYDSRLRQDLAAKDEGEVFARMLNDITAAPSPRPHALRPKASPAARVLALLRRVPLHVRIATACAAAAVVLLSVIYIITNKGTVKIDLSDPNAKVEVKIDGTRIEIAGLKDPLRLSVGEHALEVTSGEFKTFTKSFNIRRGEQEPVKVTLVPKSAQSGDFPLLPREGPDEGKTVAGRGGSEPLPTPTGPAPPPAIAPFDAAKAKEHQEAWAKHLGVPIEITNSIGMRLVLIPAGEFDMGFEPPGTQHHVRITKPFWLGLSEVTQGQYEQIMGANPSAHKSAGLLAPVETVSWEEATEFCRKLSAIPAEKAAGRAYRLPTEAEWEYACRAGTTTLYYCGDSEGDLEEFAWFHNNSQGASHPVAQKKANAWGLFDMHGNVSEWCADWHKDDYYRESAQDDPLGPSSGEAHVIRGGSYSHNAGNVRSAARFWQVPESRNALDGVRIALGLPFRGALGAGLPTPPIDSAASSPAVAPPPAVAPSDAAKATARSPSRSNANAGTGPPRAVAPTDIAERKKRKEAYAKQLGVPAEFANSVGIKLVLISGGPLSMGTAKDEIEQLLKQGPPEWSVSLIQLEGPQHRVQIAKNFFLAECEVTQAQYAKVMGRNPSFFCATGAGSSKVAGQNTDTFPVEQVSWDDARAFCAKLSALPAEKTAGRVYRLPTEAEWEFACRVRNRERSLSSVDEQTLESRAWFSGNSDAAPHPVGQKSANELGIFDMQGNVFEWCEDWYGPYTETGRIAVDPTGPASGSGRVARGGSFCHPAVIARSAFRLSQPPEARNWDIGFRVVCTTENLNRANATRSALIERSIRRDESGAPKPVERSVTASLGKSFNDLGQVIDYYEKQGFHASSRFPNSRWPARVVSEKEADEDIGLSPKKRPAGWFYAEGRRIKVVVLNDDAGGETVVVFFSREKTVEGEKSKTTR